jgi:putative spermidine/putrescine transport system substrate-binding protein
VADKMPDAPQIRPIDIVKATALKADIDTGWSKAVLGD